MVPIAVAAALAGSRILASGAIGRLALSAAGTLVATSAVKEVADTVGEKIYENQQNTNWNDNKNVTKPSNSNLKPSNNNFDGFSKRNLSTELIDSIVNTSKTLNTVADTYEYLNVDSNSSKVKVKPNIVTSSNLISSINSTGTLNAVALTSLQNTLVDINSSLQVIAKSSAVLAGSVPEELSRLNSAFITERTYSNLDGTTYKQEVNLILELLSMLSVRDSSSSSGDVSIAFDTAKLEAAITSLKPSDTMVAAQEKYYSKNGDLAEYKTTSQTLNVLSAATGFAPVSVTAKPMELEAAKHAQDAHYRRSQNEHTYDDTDFDNIFGH